MFNGYFLLWMFIYNLMTLFIVVPFEIVVVINLQMLPLPCCLDFFLFLLVRLRGLARFCAK